MPVEVSNLVKRFGTTLAVSDVSFSLADGQLMALLGPSGSGKTTVLRMLAGLERPDAGTIAIHGNVVFDKRHDVAAENRDIGMVFQDYALWPHMTVAQNISFGLRLRRLSHQATAARVSEMLALVHLDGLDHRYPDQLSGGQQQRVAIARALASRPRLLLLDEPLSNLDAALREEMRIEMVRLLKAQGITTIYVTHDRIEALAMSDTIVVMRDGRVAQIGTPEDLYARPSSAFIAGFLGAANFVAGDVRVGQDGLPAVHHGDWCLRGVAHPQLADRGMVLLRPEDGALFAGPESGEGGNQLAGNVVHSEYLGGRWRHVVEVTAEISLNVLTAQRAPATRVWVHFPVDRCLLLPESA
ncbi:MAG TPA: ABC transporter ATP-binding protein [Chloroflexota bacterium]|jgi:ABC-type Fe3+/spermidine/putrescine transport system ATPase subunit